MKKVNASNYRKDTLFPGVVRAVTEILKKGNVVTPIDVLLQTRRITPKQVEDWRFGRIPYLERVCSGNLEKLSRLLRILRLHLLHCGFEPLHTVYRKHGKGPKIDLRFTRGGEPALEAAYSTHYELQKKRKVEPDRGEPADNAPPQHRVAADSRT
jgi:hypothetical protein